MATFFIKTPGGFEVEVNAKTQDQAVDVAKKNWQTMPRIIKRQGDTRVIERQSGDRWVVSPGFSSGDPEKVKQALDGMSGAEISSQSIDKALLQQYGTEARAGEFLRGVPFVGTYTDEALGAVLGPQAKTGARALSGAMQRQRPGEALGLNLAGGLLTSAGAAAAAPAALSNVGGAVVGQGPRLAQIGRGLLGGATAGGIEGAIAGAGEGTDAQSRMGGAGTGAAIGAGFGAAVGGAGPVVAKGLENVIGLFKRSDIDQIAREFKISKNAAKVIKNTFDQGGDIEAAVRNLGRAGDEAMVADAGEAAQALLDAAAASGGRAKQIVTNEISGRMARTSAATTQALNDALGVPPAGPRTAVNEIAQRTAPARNAAYDLAYRTPIDYAAPQGRAIEGVLDRVEPKVLISAIEEANADMKARGLVNQQIMAMIDDAGNVTYREMPNVQQLDEIKKALQRIAYENTDDFGRLNGKGQRYNMLAGELRDAVADAAQPYGAAVQIGGDKISEERAFAFGRDLLRATTEVEDVGFELGKNPSQAQVSAAKSGLRSYIDKVMGDVRAIASDPGADALQAREVIKAVNDMSSRNSRAKIRELMGAEADALLAQIDEAAQSATVRAAMAQNSKTAARLAQKETIEEIAAPGAVQNAMQGELMGTTKSLVRAVTGQTSEYTAAQKQRIYEDIARALTQKKGDKARTALAVLDRAMKGQELTEAQTDQLSKLIAETLFAGATPQLTKGAAAENRQAQ